MVSCQKTLSQKDKEQYTKQGKEIAQATAQRLGGELMKYMKDGGVKKAAPYCNAHADELTNEIAKKFNATIKRTSHKLRNEKNAPDAKEQEIIAHFQKLITEGQNTKPVVEVDKDGKPHFYAPIKLQKKCTACHGIVGETMKQQSDSIIKTLYPKDKAIGFKEGDLRAIWSIRFNE